MLDTVFMYVLDMTKTASIVIAVVLLARLLLKKAPKIFSYALWAVVLFRLLCPVSIEAPVSVVPRMELISESYTLADDPISLGDAGQAAQRAVGDALNGGLGVQHIPTTEPNGRGGVEHVTSNWWEGWILFGQYVWLAGIGIMVIYSVVSYILLSRKLIGAVPLRDNIYLADHIGSPFVMGFIRPKIYLPSSLSEQEQAYIILHEQHHIRRLDHVVKGLSFLALCIHWFNPLVWTAFVLSGKDMEMSCDEAVVKQLGEGIRGDYSASLLSLATGRRIIAGTPLAFGEGDTKSRIKNMLNWKKPKVWVTAVAAVACVAVVAACVGDPETEEEMPEPANQQTEENIPELTAQGRYGTAEDVSYYLELVAGTEFQNMNLDKQLGLLAEYEDLLDDYTLIARETTDGKSSYIVGAYTGSNLETSPLRGMYRIESYTGEEEFYQLLYREADSAAVEEAMAAQKEPSVGYRIMDSQIFLSSNGGIILIQPKDNALSLDVALNRYLYSPNGREYIADAASRGIAMCDGTEPYLYVYLISERFGEIAERISLTDAEAAAIMAEERIGITEGFGFSATLHLDGQTTYYNEHEGVPQSVLDLAVERCNYKFADPSYITGDVLEAALDCDWLDTTLYAEKADLPRLREILKNAEFGYVGSCGYGAKLTLTLTGGEKLTVFKGADDCDTVVFGSFGGYFIGNRENSEFWEIFGLDPDTKEPLEDLPAPSTLPVVQLSDAENTAACNAILSDLRTGWWNAEPLKACPYEAAAFQCLHREESGSVLKLYGYGRYSRWDGSKALVEDWGTAVIVTLNADALRMTDFWVPGDGAAYESDIFANFPAEIAGAVAEPDPVKYQEVRSQLLEACRQTMQPAAQSSEELPAYPPTEDDVHNAIMANIEAVINSYGSSGSAGADYLAEAHAHLAQEWADEKAYTFYSKVQYAAYVFQNGKYDTVDSVRVPTMLTFTWDGNWRLTEFWTPGSTTSVGNVFPAEAVEILNRNDPTVYYSELPAKCDEQAVRYYAAQTGVVPAKTFTPEDVNFSGQVLASSQDEMSYEERLAWVQSGPNYEEFYTSLGQYKEGEGCIACLCAYVGTPHNGAYVFEFRFADGTMANLPLPRDGYWSSALPDSMEFQSGNFTYNVTFTDELLKDEGQSLIHLKGTYHYEVDLAAKTVSLTVLQA